MNRIHPVISGIGIIAPNGVEKNDFLKSIFEGRDSLSKISNFQLPGNFCGYSCEIKNFDATKYLGKKGLRNLDIGTLMLLSATSLALDDAKLAVNDSNCENIGVSTATTFAHIPPILDFSNDFLREGINYSNPALFPQTVINAQSSQVSIKFKLKAFSSTTSSGFTGGMEALKYALNAIENRKAETVVVGAVDPLSLPLYFSLSKLGYISTSNNAPLNCPYDKRRNSPVPGEGAAVLIVENELTAKKRNARIYASISSVAAHFDCAKTGKMHSQGLGLEHSILKALKDSNTSASMVDYISGSANSSIDLDLTETQVLKRIFGENIYNKPISSIKSMIGETFSPASLFQIVTCIGAMQRGEIPPTINYEVQDPELDLDFVPNKARKLEVKTALISSTGQGGYNAAAIIQDYEN